MRGWADGSRQPADLSWLQLRPQLCDFVMRRNRNLLAACTYTIILNACHSTLNAA